MLYILLIIIAIGVLLISTEGKELLGMLSKFALVAGGLYLVFWIILIAIALFSDKDIRENILVVAGTILLGWITIDWLIKVNVKYKNGEFKKHVLKKKVEDLWFKSWTGATLKKRSSLIFIIFLILLIIFCWIIVPFFIYK